MHFYLIEEFKDGPGNEACKILVRTKILEESVLPFRVKVFRNESLPITAEHCIGLS